MLNFKILEKNTGTDDWARTRYSNEKAHTELPSFFNDVLTKLNVLSYYECTNMFATSFLTKFVQNHIKKKIKVITIAGKFYVMSTTIDIE